MYTYMTINDQANSREGKPILEHSESLSAGQTSNSIILPDEIGNIESIMVGLFIVSGSARIEYSISPLNSVKGDNANWKAWDAGNITADDDDVLYNVTGIRCVCISGSCIFEARAV